MLEFPEVFFKDEEREGFFIGETMKRYWACCMENMNVIATVCKKHNIPWYADWGTLLGAARHKGFVPWDDDVDIALKRSDYERLLKILPQEMPEEYKLSTPFNNDSHRQFWSGLSNGKEMDVSLARRAKYYGCPFVAVIDIFPLDYLPRDNNEAELIKSLFILIWNAVELIKKEADAAEIEEAVNQVEDCLAVKLDRSKNLRNQLWQVANQLAMSYGEEDGDELIPWCFYVNRGVRFDQHWYDNTVDLPFENITVPAPAEYDKVLTSMYGDWHKRVRGGQAHDYPCFKRQLEFLRKKVKEMLEEEQRLKQQ